MLYTVKDVVTETGLSEYTIRFYDKEGLLPKLPRTQKGNRLFTQEHLDWLKLVCCLKNSGMSILDIKTFMASCTQEEGAAEQRKQLLLLHKKNILNQISHLQDALSIVDYKIDHSKELGVFHLEGITDPETK